MRDDKNWFTTINEEDTSNQRISLLISRGFNVKVVYNSVGDKFVYKSKNKNRNAKGKIFIVRAI